MKDNLEQGAPDKKEEKRKQIWRQNNGIKPKFTRYRPHDLEHW